MCESIPASLSPPRLPAEIVADIIELAILTSSPCPRFITCSSSTSDKADEPRSPFTTPLRSTHTSAWSWTTQLLYVSKFFHSIALPLLLRTLTLETPGATASFFNSTHDVTKVRRAWLGNLTAAAREGGVIVDPIELKLEEAAWYEECSSGFVVGHAYASRLKQKRNAGRKERERQYRSVSVYWAEEELVEEVSDPERSSESDGSDGDEVLDGQEGHESARSLPSTSAQGEAEEGMLQRRTSHQEQSRRTDRPLEPAWQTVYSRRRSPMRSGRASAANGGPVVDVASNSIGPAEGDLDPWDMQDAQERLAALANAPAGDTSHNSISSDAASPTSSSPTSQDQHTPQRQPRHPRREIYAYHLTTATLEPFINPLLSSLRSLRLITLTFYPGHLLDDDKLEHMLRRILSPHECPRLQTLLIRIVFDSASAGSRMRRFERTKTIAGAADRIGDERVRVMLVHNRVGEGELVGEKEVGGGEVSPVSRKAILVMKEGWWARVLQQNHLPSRPPQEDSDVTQDEEASQAGKVDVKAEQIQRLSNWSMFFPPSQHANPTHLVNLVHHCDPWPDCPNPVT